MAKRYSLGRKKARKIYSSGQGRNHPLNGASNVMRGGIRL